MKQRSRARQVALQLLFQHDTNPEVPREDIVQFIRDRLIDQEARPFALELYDAVIANQKEIDQALSKAADNWKLHRMAPVDRNVLRLGLGELAYLEEPTPRPVAIDEAIELARQFGSKDSPGFVNGVLDKAAPKEKPTESEAPE
jgi:transcription antitermination protein NusB